MWALSASLAVQLAPNPIYVAIVVLIAAVLVGIHRTDAVMGRAFPLLVGVGVVFALFRIALSALTTHGSGGTVLFTLPSLTLPRLLGGFEVGGAVEVPVLAQTAAEVIPVIGIMAAFGAFNAVVAHHELLRSAPRALHEPALVITVAITIVPATVRAVRDVREADRARAGTTARRGRTLRTLLPVLETGMERAINLAESMDARGFARRPASRAEQAGSWLLFLGLVGLSASFLALVGQQRATAAAFAATGTAMLVAAVIFTSRGSARTRYRPRRLTATDLAVMVGVALCPAALALAAANDEPSLEWVTSPLQAPTTAVLPLLALLLLLVPAAVRPAPVPATAHELVSAAP